MASESLLALEGLRKSLGETLVIDDFTVRHDGDEFLVIVGPSGCGKTTLLRLAAALIRPDAGAVLYHGHEVRKPPPGVGVVFQDYTRSLFPWLSVRKNVRFGLQRRKAADLEARVEEAIAAVGLSGFEDRYPWQLSGGMQQRAALARALAARPEVLLMDEPFASVDAQTRMDLQLLVMSMCEEFSISAVFVTHDIDEAVLLADRIVILSNRPASVKESLPVELPRPRDQIHTRAMPEFAELREHVYDRVRFSNGAAAGGRGGEG